MPQRDSISSTSLLNFEAWRALLRTICGRYNPEGIEHNAFIGWVRPMNVCGLAAVDIGWNAHRLERTQRIFASMGRSIIMFYFKSLANQR